MHKLLIDLTGRRFGSLLVLKPAKQRRGDKRIWICICDCGRKKRVLGANLREIVTRSCGCLKAKRGGRRLATNSRRNKNRTHGMSSSVEYATFHRAKQRCQNPRATGFQYYGGRGIKFLFDSFEEFFQALGPRPRGMTLDRIDNDGNYTAGKGQVSSNIRWATRKEQAANKRPRKRKPPNSGFAIFVN